MCNVKQLLPTNNFGVATAQLTHTHTGPNPSLSFLYFVLYSAIGLIYCMFLSLVTFVHMFKFNLILRFSP